ncbi:MAG: PEP-CTERM sorting domain-containing protein [Alphaproteobacteria bacterium]
MSYLKTPSLIGRTAALAAAAAVATIALSTTAMAGPIVGNFSASGGFADGTDLTPAGGGAIVNDGNTTLNGGDGDYTGIPVDGGMLVSSIDPLVGAVPINDFLMVVSGDWNLDFALLSMSDPNFSATSDFNIVTFTGSGNVTGSRPGDAAVDGTFDVSVTAQQSINDPDGEGSWSATFISPADVPEPTTALVFGTALAGLGLAARRKRRSS